MFELDRFIADCRAALGASASHGAVREVVARAVCEPGAVLRALGEPKRAQIQTLHRSHDLTILNVIWAPRMVLLPHDHRMWAVIGIYTGREDNVFWRRLPGSAGGKVEAAGARALCEKDAVPLGEQVIHSVINPIARFTGAIHVYGGGRNSRHGERRVGCRGERKRCGTSFARIPRYNNRAAHTHSTVPTSNG